MQFYTPVKGDMEIEDDKIYEMSPVMGVSKTNSPEFIVSEISFKASTSFGFLLLKKYDTFFTSICINTPIKIQLF